MKRSFVIAITATVGVFVVTVSGGSAFQVAPADLAGEVKVSVSLPPGKQRPHRTAIPVHAIVSVTIASETGSRVLREMIFTNTKLGLWVPPGRYSVRSEIGPPTVNPTPRQCGKARLVVAKDKQASFTLACVLR